MSEQTRPEAIILDTGELTGIRATLDALSVPYAAESDAGDVGEVHMLISSLARASEMHEAGEPLPKHTLHIVVGPRDVADLRGALGSASCDILVREPVDTAVLKLVAERAGHDANDRRHHTRVAIGEVVAIRSEPSGGFRDAILAQVSVGGCAVVTPEPIEAKALTIRFPVDVTHDRELVLRGDVIRSTPVSTSDGQVYDTAMRFDTVRLSDRVSLRSMMAGQPIDTGLAPAPAAVEEVMPPTDRRATPRVPYTQRSLGVSPSITRVLIGRDISHAGMRIEREPDLALGDPLRLALYASDCDDPVVLTAFVRRDDGTDGWFLGFETMEDETAAGLQALIETLARNAGEGDAGSVVSELLESA